MATLRKQRGYEPVSYPPSETYGRWKFPPEVHTRMAYKARAARTEALIRASDLEDEVWHFWLDEERRKVKEGANSSTAVVGPSRTPKSSVDFGSMRFIVDIGCGYNLLGGRYVRSADATGMIRELHSGITLNTAGGLSRSLGTVSVRCPKFKD